MPSFRLRCTASRAMTTGSVAALTPDNVFSTEDFRGTFLKGVVVRSFIPCAVCLLVGLAAGWMIPREAVISQTEFITSGEVYESQTELLGRFVAAFKSKDADRCADLYSADAVYMVPSSTAQIGNPAIRQGYVDTFESMAETQVKTLSEPIEQIVSMGDWAVLRGWGEITESQSGEDTTQRYNWMILSRKDSKGTWKIVWDIFSLADAEPDSGTES